MAAILAMRCDKCLVKETCPRFGSSPLMILNHPHLCQVIGGYGRIPIDQSILSEESKQSSAQNGPCLTIAEVPTYDEDSGKVRFVITKIFHKPFLNERERSDYPVHLIYPKSPS
jgi:hypothetical protein